MLNLKFFDIYREETNEGAGGGAAAGAGATAAAAAAAETVVKTGEGGAAAPAGAAAGAAAEAGAAAGGQEQGKGAEGGGATGAAAAAAEGKAAEAAVGADGKPIVAGDGKPADGKGAAAEAAKDGEVKPVEWSDEKAALIASYPADQQAKIKQVLDKYGTKVDAVRALAAADSKIQELGEKAKNLVKLPTKDSTPEERALYRKAAGIPETPDKYEIPRPEGFEPTELDTAFETSFRKAAHDLDLTPAMVAGLAKLDVERARLVQEHINTTAAAAKKASEDDLRIHFGVKGYEPAVELTQRFWDKNFLPHFSSAEAAQAFMRTPGPNGLPPGTDPGFIKAMAAMAMQFEDSGAFVDGEPMTGASMETEIKQLKGLIGTDAYGNDQASRLNKLIEQQNRINKKSKAA